MPPKSKTKSRWTVGCEAENLLTDQFDGDVLYKGKKLTEMDAAEFPAPIDVYKEFADFYDNFSTNVFRTHWNQEKSARVIAPSVHNDSTQNVNGSPVVKRKSPATSNDLQSTETKKVSTNEIVKPNESSLHFTSLFMTASWTAKRTALDRVSILIWLPSGIGSGKSNGRYGMRVVDDGKFLEVSYMLPAVITDVQSIIERAEDVGCVLEHSEIVGFQSEISSVRPSKMHSMQCQGYIELPFTVVSDISERFNLGCTDCGYLLSLVRLTAHKDQGEVLYDSGNFVFNRTSTRNPNTPDVFGDGGGASNPS